MRRVLATAAVLSCALGLAACNDDDSAGSSGPMFGGEKPGGSAKSGRPLLDSDPCALVKVSEVPELSQVSSTELTPTSYDTASCGRVDFTVYIEEATPDIYATEFTGPTSKPLPDLAGHKAATSMEASRKGTCNVVLEVTKDELVKLTFTDATGDGQKACAVAQKAAAVVAPRLP